MQRNIKTGSAALLKQVDKDIAAAEKRRDTAVSDLTGLQTIRQSIVGVELNGATQRTTQGSRTDALTEIIRNANGDVTVDDLMLELKRQGRQDDKRLVHSTVSYLQRKGIVQRVDRGTWRATQAA